MKNLLQQWLRKRREDDTTTTTIITASPAVDATGKSVWNFPPPELEVPPQEDADDDDTGTFEVLDAPPGPKKESRGSFDPYDTGSFNKSKAWGRVKKRKR